MGLDNLSFKLSLSIQALISRYGNLLVFECYEM